MRFEELGLSEPLLRALRSEKYETATPIQAQAIPAIADGRDLVGCAQTGTGKTAAFALPTLERLMERGMPSRDKRRAIRTLVLCPTRELALQIGESFDRYGRHTGMRHTVIFGGVGQQPQVRALQNGVDIVIATPGRLLDLMNQGYVRLEEIEILILDEADRMLDMGFIHDLRRIVARTPRERQTLLFSATMPEEIRQLAKQWLREPVDVRVTPVSSTVEIIAQQVVMVPQKQKMALLSKWLGDTARGRTIVFCRTKHGSDKIVRYLEKTGHKAEAIHGNKSQNARQRALEKFKSNKPPVLVATDIAVRGLDVDDITHVVNFDVPHEPETYVHRIGRSGRAGASGEAIAFCDPNERGDLQAIERLIRRKIDVVQMDIPAPAGESLEDRPRGSGGGNRRFGGNREGRPQGSSGGGRPGGGSRGKKSGGKKFGGRPGERPRDGQVRGNAEAGRAPGGERRPATGGSHGGHGGGHNQHGVQGGNHQGGHNQSGHAARPHAAGNGAGGPNKPHGQPPRRPGGKPGHRRAL
ncbi:MAG: DEAD/DEAH box helicase [Pirellulales bacterium]